MLEAEWVIKTGCSVSLVPEGCDDRLLKIFQAGHADYEQHLLVKEPLEEKGLSWCRLNDKAQAKQNHGPLTSRE